MLGIHRLTDLGAGSCCVTTTITGSTNIYANNLSIARTLDLDIGSGCCFSPGVLIQGSPGVFANGRNVHRLTDLRMECCGPGVAITASTNMYA